MSSFPITPKEGFELIVSIIIGATSIYSASISKKVERGIIKYNDIQSYNKNRKKIAQELKEHKTFLIDNDIKIDLTNISKLQSSIQKLMQYNSILEKNERRKLSKTLSLINHIENKKRTVILENLNYFIAKLEKGDMVI